MIATQLAKRKKGAKVPTIWQPIINVKIPKGLFNRAQVGGNAAPSPINATPPDTTSVQAPAVVPKKKKKKAKSMLSNPLVLGGIGVGVLVLVIMMAKKKQQTPLEKLHGYAKGVGAALGKSL